MVFNNIIMLWVFTMINYNYLTIYISKPLLDKQLLKFIFYK